MNRETFEHLKSMGIPFDDDFEELIVILTVKEKERLAKLKAKPEIIYIEATQKTTPQADPNFVGFYVKINMSNNIGLNRLVVVIDDREFQTYRAIGFNQPEFYAADVYVDLSIPRDEETFKLTANLVNTNTNKITNTKSINVKINKSGVVEETGEEVGEVEKKSKCFCFNQGLVKGECNKGATISDEIYENLSLELDIEKKVILAIAKQETKKNSFIQLEPKKCTILLERHYVFKLFKAKYGLNKAEEYQNLDSSLCNIKPTQKGGYGKSKEQHERLSNVKNWDNDIAIKSCSWGKFQVMGIYLENSKLYKDAKEFEEAMNLCEIQHFVFFKSYLINVVGKPIIKALKDKNWEKIAELYNGKNWKKTNPEYATNLKKFYNELED